MNYKELVEHLGLEKNQFMELVELFIAAGLSDLSKLKDAIDEKNVLQVERPETRPGAVFHPLRP
jgi:hypothetical protein